MKIIAINQHGAIEKHTYSRAQFAQLFDDLNIRDLRPVFSPFQVATIIPRDHATIINMGFIKCVLTDKNVFFLLHRHEKAIQKIAQRIASAFQDTSKSSRVILALEIIFDAKLTQISDKMADITLRAEHTLTQIRKGFSEKDLEDLLAIKKRLSKIEARGKEILSAAEDVLDDPEDFAQILSLTHHAQHDKDELESIFENFIEQLEDIAGHIFRLSENIQDTEEFAHLTLSARRTTIIRIDLFATLFTLILSFLAVIVGLYGMNIPNGLENNHTAFLLLSGLLVFIFITSLGIIFYHLKKKLFI